ncbi:glycine dehydrogenase [candidate division TA06 bacterium DG_24]|uniref:Probable glycine dehydrogenase (decarboxylating) subunit 2 n=3 Tax=Bacteria division TA06 TaxID=1156500 RepID=A0A0S8G4B3_UNCT6|nr:MAG: glycine dehydrogenase [candidate division TA06 bacterium DG_24]KPK67641.1 MAG: glycine dehydrogenase [candidate division TA06 bacterium SM23_40]
MNILEPTIFDLSQEGRQGAALPDLDVPEKPLEELLPEESLRRDLPHLPEVSEPEVVRHFIHLSSFNHHIDKGFYPLGSCTMKYNPKVNEVSARLPGFARVHPLAPAKTVQGALRLMHELGDLLCRISGLDEVTLQPAAGAQGELAGLMMIRAYHDKRGHRRSKVLIPDSAHGTNPASVTLAGYRSVQVASNDRGLVDIDDLRRAADEEVAALMLTNPNTLGLFESDIEEIERIVHGVGAQLYMDGANLNALLGIARPGDMGFDVVHFNLHKTFSTPHGGGGPGAGPVGVKAHIGPFLPVPVILRDGEEYRLDYDRPDSIGKIQSFYGNFGVMVRAYTYIRMMGARGLRAVSENAIINANYLKRKLEGTYDLPYPQHCQHEFVLSGRRQKEQGVKTLDIAKRLLDFGVHAPTIYFPLIVPEALMIEPTETESKESLDAFIDAMLTIAREVSTDPERVRTAPHTTPVRRLDEAGAGRKLDVRQRADRGV